MRKQKVLKTCDIPDWIGPLTNDSLLKLIFYNHSIHLKSLFNCEQGFGVAKKNGKSVCVCVFVPVNLTRKSCHICLR